MSTHLETRFFSPPDTQHKYHSSQRHWDSDIERQKVSFTIIFLILLDDVAHRKSEIHRNIKRLVSACHCQFVKRALRRLFNQLFANAMFTDK